jgi:hypothetical protein
MHINSSVEAAKQNEGGEEKDTKRVIILCDCALIAMSECPFGGITMKLL